MAMTGRQMTVVAALVLVATTLVHGPTLTSAPQFDLVQYWTERHEWPALSEAVRRLDFPIERRYWKGDEAEFRPLLFLFLAIEYSAFGLDIRYWHAAQLLLHFVVGWLLFRLLRRTQSFVAALSLACLFLTLSTTVHLVNDPYVGGYMIACALWIVGVGHAWNALEGSNHVEWWRYAAVMTIAGFLFEVFAVTALCAAPVFLLEAKRRGRSSQWLPLLLLAPILVFAIVYLIRLPFVPRLMFVDDAPDRDLLSSTNVWTVPMRSVSMFVRLTAQTMAPAMRSFWLDRPAADLRLAAVVTNVAALFGAGLVIWRGRRAWPANTWRIAAIAAMLAGYILFVRFGRGVEDGNHLYPFAVLVIVLAGLVVDVAALSARIRRAAVVVMAALIAVNAVVAIHWTVREGRSGAEFSRYVAAIQSFVRQHQGESTFSFAVLPSALDETFSVTLLEGYPDMPVREADVPPAQALFGGTSIDRAGYRLRWTGSLLEIDSAKD